MRFGRPINLKPDLPRDLYFQALDWKAKGKTTILISVCSHWFLLQEPTLQEYAAYSRGLSISPEETVQWLLSRILLEPSLEDLEYLYGPGMMSTLIQSAIHSFQLDVSDLRDRLTSSRQESESLPIIQLAILAKSAGWEDPFQLTGSQLINIAGMNEKSLEVHSQIALGQPVKYQLPEETKEREEKTSLEEVSPNNEKRPVQGKTVVPRVPESVEITLRDALGS